MQLFKNKFSRLIYSVNWIVSPLIKRTVFYYLLVFVILLGCNNSVDTKNQKIKNIILIISNDIDASSFNSIRSSNFQREHALQIAKIHHTSSNCNPLINELSIGKVINESNYIGLDSNGVAQPNLIELASIKGLSTGLVTINSLTDALPASFIAHGIDKYQFESIAESYMNSPVDLIIGGGAKYFVNRTDNTDLLKRFKNKGFSIYPNLENVEKRGKIFILLDESPNGMQKTESNMVVESSKIAMETLASNPNGFFLIIDGVQEYPQSERHTLPINVEQTIGLAFDFADKNEGTLVLVVSSEVPFSSVDGEIIKNDNSIIGPADKGITTYAYGTLSETFSGIFEETEVFTKINTLMGF